MNEFDLITHFFTRQQQQKRDDVIVGIGDDCAILAVPSDMQLLVSMDTLISGVHFPVQTSPYDIGYKSLAVNLSDIAAMGGVPSWFTLALTLPEFDESWLASFSEGLFRIAGEFDVVLVGGDTTRGSSLAITIQAHGFAPIGKAVTRLGAQVCDWIYVTNTLGDAGLALKHIQKKIHLSPGAFSSTVNALNRPYPRIKEGLLLAQYATAMIDISDGLISDLKHLLTQSGVGALIHLEQLPLSTTLKESLVPDLAMQLALSAGDDYELCCTIPYEKKSEIETLMANEGYKITCIGQIKQEQQLTLQQGGQILDLAYLQGYAHF